MNARLGRAQGAARADQMIQMRLQGISLRDIATQFGVSHEWVRLIIQEAGGPSTGEIRRLKAARMEREREGIERRVRAYLADGSLRTAQEVAQALDVTPQVVREVLGRDAGKLLIAAARNWVRASDAELFEELQVAADLVEGPLTGAKYDAVARELGLHSRVRLTQRFGSWVKACEAAGVEPGRAMRSYRRQWTRAQMVQWVARFLSEPQRRGSYVAYGDYARATVGAPSAQTIRNEFGSWPAAKAEALKSLRNGASSAA